MNLSIIIPVRNEATKITADIKASVEFLLQQGWPGQIIAVNDGSTDNTEAVARQVSAAESIPIEIISYQTPRGKGYALREGVKASTGELVLFTDSGCCVPLENALRGIELIQTDQCAIAHGSRKLPESHIQVSQNRYRRLCSRCFLWFVHAVMKLPLKLTDTQCGFKVYRGHVARQLFSECRTDGFMIDVELILRACKHGWRIHEFPVEWTCDRDSRTNPLRQSWQMVKELRQIKRLMR